MPSSMLLPHALVFTTLLSTYVAADAWERRYANTTSLSSRLNTAASIPGNISKAIDCDFAHQSWSAYLRTAPITQWKNITYTTTQTFLANSTPYTLCDGFPRFDGSTEISLSVRSPALPPNTTVTAQQSGTASATSPTAPACSIASSDCAALSSLWSTSCSRQPDYANSSDTTRSPFPSTWALGVSCSSTPICGGKHSKMTEQEAQDLLWGLTHIWNKGQVLDNTVKLLYWPVTTISNSSGQSCNGSVTVSATAGSPFYGSFKDFIHHVIPQNATDISSYCLTNGSIGFGTPVSLNYADFYNPVPARVYTCQPKCFSSSPIYHTTTAHGKIFGVYHTVVTSYLYIENGRCSTIWDDYAPAIYLPSLGEGFLRTHEIYYNPPVALTSTLSAAGVTTPAKSPATATSETPSVSAQPASSIDQPTPIATTDPAAQTGGSTAVASNAVLGATGVAVSQPGTFAKSDSSSWQPISVTTEPVNSDAQDSEANRVSPTQVVVPSTVDPQSTATSVAFHTSSSRGIGDIIASILGMSKSSALPGFSAASGSYGETSLPTLATSGYQTPTHAGLLDGEPSTVSDGLGTPIGGPLVSLLRCLARQELLITILYEGTMSLNPVLADGDRAMLAPAATTGTVVLGESSQLAAPEFAIAGVTFAAGRTLPVALGSGLVLTPGGLPLVLSGQTISMATFASYWVMGSATIWPTVPATSTPPAPMTVILTVDGQAYTADSGTKFSFGPSAVLSPGGTLTVSGHTMSLDPSGHNIAVNGVTSTLALLTGLRSLNTGELSASAAVSSMTPIVSGGSIDDSVADYPGRIYTRA
ncbi:hypothetical protein LTS10_011542 [Elasticomyces elasticus]|nr:hypothetical protein LTS10_011542 [Elasticomyces elasticus]